MSQQIPVSGVMASRGGPWDSNRSASYSSNAYLSGSSVVPLTPNSAVPRLDSSGFQAGSVYTGLPSPVQYGTPGLSYGVYSSNSNNNSNSSQARDPRGRYSSADSVEDIITSPNLSDYSLETAGGNAAKKNNSNSNSNSAGSRRRSQRRPSNRDEFDGPHQFLQRPPPNVIAMQERDLPHLPTNLHVQEQDHILSRVNDRLSQCAFDFVAKYQFPIPLTQDMRPVECARDREWTEWVYLLKRLATKRRIPAHVLYNGQIKQFVTILESSLEMKHASKHQSRPLKDDRNILQLISAGIQVAKILKDAPAMDYLDQLYVSTDMQIRDRTHSRFRA
ncbi:hypothetical protein GMORB2_2120 [Geosmithia morbida]|uniref:Uncharacterized protein n=1 Tax=Geosmithia morbida TaxID=1094350 RepID=A0A9P5CZ42_9HYPO|nr:uncharacterized protein GMORB2_2120 [Geosmithia morbida]KAF4121158.1 hypothetical protein GMORB2_2120 [Geosmithia morbida]